MRSQPSEQRKPRFRHLSCRPAMPGLVHHRVDMVLPARAICAVQPLHDFDVGTILDSIGDVCIWWTLSRMMDVFNQR